MQRIKERERKNKRSIMKIILSTVSALHVLFLSHSNTNTHSKNKHQTYLCLSSLSCSQGVIKLTFKNAWAP